jgi:hypothetical protein
MTVVNILHNTSINKYMKILSIVFLIVVFNSLMAYSQEDRSGGEKSSQEYMWYGAGAIVKGRELRSFEFAKIDSVEYGTFIFDILINKKGEVIKATFNEEESDSVSELNKLKFKESAMNVTFNKVIFGKKISKGTAKFEFIRDEKSRVIKKIKS